MANNFLQSIMTDKRISAGSVARGINKSESTVRKIAGRKTNGAPQTQFDIFRYINDNLKEGEGNFKINDIFPDFNVKLFAIKKRIEIKDDGSYERIMD